MRYASLSKGNELLGVDVEVADNVYTRFLGLMFRRNMPQNHVLLLTPCSSIHTFSMRFAIDAVFISSNGTILHIEKSMKPNKIGKTIKKAKSVLEFNTGITEKIGLVIGDIIKINYIDNTDIV